MFVTVNNFANVPYKLPGLTGGTLAAFNQFIADQESEQLRKLVGNLFYDAMVTGIGGLPNDWDDTNKYMTNDQSIYNGAVWKSTIDDNLGNTPGVIGWVLNPNPLVDRWIPLRDGSNYQIATITNCPTFRWAGMDKLVTPMIYSLWLPVSIRSNSGQGIVISANENSVLVNPEYEISKSWRSYYITAGKTLHYFNRKQVDIQNSLYGYLVAVAANFNDIVTDASYPDFLTYIQNQFSSPDYGPNAFDL